MSATETAVEALTEAASNPKIAIGVAATTTSLGAASTLELLQGGLGLASVIIGCIVGLFVIRVHAIKYKILRRAWENDVPINPSEL